jgi:antitoxin component YwqK of YwqJK toxin-antitoxin module
MKTFKISFLFFLLLSLSGCTKMVDKSEITFVNDNAIYKNEKFTGVVTTKFIVDGKNESKTTYKNGKLEGSYKVKYFNKKIKEKGCYKDGKLDGPYETYYENGQLKEKGCYKNGLFDGKIETYNDKSELIGKIRYFKDGNEINEREYLDEK